MPPVSARAMSRYPRLEAQVRGAETQSRAGPLEWWGARLHVEDAHQLVSVLDRQSTRDQLHAAKRVDVDDSQGAVEVFEVVRLVEFHPVDANQKLLVEPAPHIELRRDVSCRDSRQTFHGPEYVFPELGDRFDVIPRESLLGRRHLGLHDAKMSRRDHDVGEAKGGRIELDRYRYRSGIHPYNAAVNSKSDARHSDFVLSGVDLVHGEASIGSGIHGPRPADEANLGADHGGAGSGFPYHTGDSTLGLGRHRDDHAQEDCGKARLCARISNVSSAIHGAFDVSLPGLCGPRSA